MLEDEGGAGEQRAGDEAAQRGREGAQTGGEGTQRQEVGEGAHRVVEEDERVKRCVETLEFEAMHRAVLALDLGGAHKTRGLS